MKGITKSQTTCSPVQMAKLVDSGSLALDRINRLSEVMSALRDICAKGELAEQGAERRLESLKAEGIRLMEEHVSTPCAGQLEFDVMLSVSRSATATDSNAHRIHVSLPDFSDYAAGVMTNVDTVRQLDHQSFLTRLQYSYDTQLGSQATVQGVRISARYPRDSRALPCRAVNSLSVLTGFSAAILGNATFSQRPAQDIGIPLKSGDVSLNGVDIDESDGSFVDLLEKINAKSADHGLQGSLFQGNTLVLDCLAGNAIRLVIKTQVAALVSGYMPGVLHIPPQSCGLLVWLADSDQPLQFDSDRTSMALNGCAASELGLSRFGLQDLSCESASLAQLSSAVLARLGGLITKHQKKLQLQLQTLLEKLSESTSRYVETCFESVQRLERSLLCVPH